MTDAEIRARLIRGIEALDVPVTDAIALAVGRAIKVAGGQDDFRWGLAKINSQGGSSFERGMAVGMALVLAASAHPIRKA